MVASDQLRWQVLSTRTLLITLPVDEPPCFLGGILFYRGNLQDPPKLKGAHALMLSLLTSADEGWQKRWDDLGVILDGEASDEFSFISFSFLPDFKEKALHAISRFLTSFAWQKAIFQQKKKQFITNLRILKEDPAQQIKEKSLAFAFPPPHPLGIPTTPGSVKRLSMDTLLPLAGKLLSEGPAIGVFMGPADHETLSRLFQSAFSTFHHRHSNHFAYTPLVFKEPKRLIVEKKGLSQTYIHGFIGLPPILSKNYLPLRLALYLLVEGGFESWLMEKLRVNLGSTYGITGDIQMFHRGNLLHITAALQGEKALTAIQIIESSYQELLKKGIEEKDLDRAKEALLNARILLWDDPTEVLAYLLRQTYGGLSRDAILSWEDRLSQITPSDIFDALHTLPPYLECLGVLTSQPKPLKGYWQKATVIHG